MSVLESLDVRGLLCPMPVIRAQNRIRDLPEGAVLEVIATDAGTLQDIPAWCRVHGHELLLAATEEAAGTALRYRFEIRVKHHKSA